jgi:pyruvate,water dikinase
MEQFRSMFHKPVIYASWDWHNTVEDAMRHAGFASFEEQEQALEKQRSKSW